MKFLELPRLGETMEEGQIIAWLKAPGQVIKRGEVVAEIGTDKIVAELPALEDFVLEEILAGQGSTVKVGQPIARIRSAAQADTPQPMPTVAPAAASTIVSSSAVPTAPAPASAPLRASPAARKLARDLNINLNQVIGTGPRGRITTEDVRGAQLQPLSASTAQAAVLLPGAIYSLTRIEQATAKSTSQSKREVPHFYVRVRANLSTFMERYERARSQGLSATINDALVKAAALSLRQHPRLNAVLEGQHLRLLPEVNIGVITAAPQGLVTSVVRGADQLDLAQIAERVRSIRGRADSGRIRTEDSAGATFCISNLGKFEVEEFSAIIPQPNVAILAVGTLSQEVIATGGAIRIAHTLRLTLSADHRALDGVEAARFLQTLRQVLEGMEFGDQSSGVRGQ